MKIKGKEKWYHRLYNVFIGAPISVVLIVFCIPYWLVYLTYYIITGKEFPFGINDLTEHALMLKE